MRFVPAIAVTVALALNASAAAASKKHHPRYARHPHAAAVARGPDSSFAPAHMIEARPGVFISSYGCIQDEGYGRWTYCGQGRGGN
ncbi:MAG: hypothetical protein JO328_17320 [Hyphomicrobiales bacterium]|nr:hypothetical protein [Hyphomicrobiales bacterium]